MQHEADRGDEERSGNPVAVQQIEYPLEGDPRAILALGERPDARLAGAQRQRLVVHVEGEQHRDPSAVGPLLRLQAPACAHRVDHPLDRVVRPFPCRAEARRSLRDDGIGENRTDGESDEARKQETRHGFLSMRSPVRRGRQVHGAN